MADYQSDLTDHEPDASEVAVDLTEDIVDAADNAVSELDFGQRIRGSLDSVLDTFNAGIDYSDVRIGSVSEDDVLNALEKQGLTIDDVEFDRDELHTGGMEPDAVVGSCVTDYKHPPGKLERGRASRRQALAQLTSYMIATAEKQNTKLEDTVGVLLDGERYLFVHGDDFSQVEERPVNEGSTEAYASLFANHYAVLTADRLTSDFGTNKPRSSDMVEALFEAIKDGNERSEKIFEEWKLLFEQVCGFDFDDKEDVLEEHYDIEINTRKEFRQALFAVYTYYGLIAKLVAAEFVYYHTGPNLPSFSKRLIGRQDDDLRERMASLEDGWVFQEAGITNFLEAGLFSWYVDEDVWTDDLAEATESVVERIQRYDPGEIRDNPDKSRDVFKNLYQHMVPPELREQLGEVFTPDWLANLTLNDAGFEGSGRMLDPACGSGTFLVLAARRKKEHFGLTDLDSFSDSEVAEKTRKLLGEIEGFDLNPLAVLAARANLLIELGELVDYTPEVELPVYLCDSIRPPAAGTQLTGSFYEVNEVPENGSSDTDIEIKVPQEIVERELVSDYFETAEECSSDGVDADTFINVFDNEYGINKGFTRNALRESYGDMMSLRERDVDGIWWEIVKNRFRPRFCGKFDYVIGNPPYITLDKLPQSYRDDIVDEWERYGIAPNGQGGARKMEHALLFAARALDKYVKKEQDADDDDADDVDGVLSFILPSSVQRGGKADAFRKHISRTTRVQSITDTADLNPFDVTKNRTVILTAQNSGETDFPVPCETWIGDRPDFTASLEQVRRDTEQYDFHAKPLDDFEGKWFSAPNKALDAFTKLHGDGHYDAHEGINFIGGKGLFYVDVLNENTGLVKNTNSGRKDWGQVRTQIDLDLLYPTTSGQKVNKWGFEIDGDAIIPHKPNGDTYTKDELYTQYRNTHDFLYHDDLNMEVGERKFYNNKLNTIDDKEDHFLYAVGSRMFSEYKAVYPDISGGTYIDFEAATLEPVQAFGTTKPVMFNKTVFHIETDNRDEAYYLSGILNSTPVRAFMRAHSVLHANARAVEEINIPEFDSSNDSHEKIAEKSEKAHNVLDPSSLEDEMDELVVDIFDVTDEELDTIEDYLTVTNT